MTRLFCRIQLSIKKSRSAHVDCYAGEECVGGPSESISFAHYDKSHSKISAILTKSTKIDIHSHMTYVSTPISAKRFDVRREKNFSELKKVDF